MLNFITNSQILQQEVHTEKPKAITLEIKNYQVLQILEKMKFLKTKMVTSSG